VYKYSLTFRVWRNETRAPIANPPNTGSTELEDTPTIPEELHPSPCSSVGLRRGTDRQTHAQTAVTTIQFASATPHAKKTAKCNKGHFVRSLLSEHAHVTTD